MSYTQAEHLFAGVHETGIKDILQSFFTARGHHLRYATFPFPVFFPNSSTPSQTIIPLITIYLPDKNNPQLTIHIGFDVEFTMPIVDVNPDNSGTDPFIPLNPPIPGMAGEFRLKTTLKVKSLGISFNYGTPFFLPPIPALEVSGRCEPFATNLSGSGDISIKVKQAAVRIVGVTLPTWLQGLLDFVMVFVLQAIFAKVIIPYSTVIIDAFELSLQVGPYAEQNQLKIRGSAL